MINEFNALFSAMFGTYCTHGNSTYAKTQINVNEGTVTIIMTKSAKDSWNGPVHDQWKQHYPDLKEIIENHPKHIIIVEEVPVV